MLDTLRSDIDSTVIDLHVTFQNSDITFWHRVNIATGNIDTETGIPFVSNRIQLLATKITETVSTFSQRRSTGFDILLIV